MERITDLRRLAGLIRGVWWWLAHSPAPLARNMEIDMKIREVLGGREALAFQWGSKMLRPRPKHLISPG
jgi:hypothetical protein